MQVALAGAVGVFWIGLVRSGEVPLPAGEGAPPPCRHLVEVSGLVSRAGVVCARSVDEAVTRAGGPRGCELSEADATTPLRPGVRLVLGEGEGTRCSVRLRWVDGARRLALGIPIDLNLASPADLEALPGIGPVLAARIVAERQRRGPFAAVNDLRRVRGIGPVKLERLRAQVAASRP